MAFSREEIDRIAKWWNNGKQLVQNEMQKQSMPAPKYGNTIPKLETLRRSQIMQGTDPASMSIKAAQSQDLKAIDRRNLDRKQEARLKKQIKQENQIRQERAKELNNVSKNLGANDIARYNRQFSLDKPMQDIDMDKLRQAQYNKARNDKKMAEMEADRKAEADARKSANRKRVESEVKSLQSKGDMRTMQEDERLNFLLESADKRGMVNKKNPYLVSRDRYDSLMQSGRLANDIEPLAMALSNGSGAQMAGTRQILSKGYNSVDDYIDQLSKRYELTPDEVRDVVKTYNADRLNKQEEQEYNALYNYGQEHPAKGSALSVLAAPAAGVEGWYNTAANAITGDDRNQSAIFSNITNAPKEGVLDTIDSNAGKMFYNIGVGGAGLALNAKGGLGAIAAMGGNASNEAMNAAIERGVAPEKAAQLGMLAGAADTAFNAQGFNAIDDALKTETVKTVKDFFKNVAVGAGTEAAENVAQDITETVADEILNREQSELRTTYQNYVNNGDSPEDAFRKTTLDYAGQLATSAGTGAIAGGLFSAGEMGTNALAGEVAARKLKKHFDRKGEIVQERVDEYKRIQQAQADRANQERIENWIANNTDEARPLPEINNNVDVDNIDWGRGEVPRVGEAPSLIADNSTNTVNNNDAVTNTVNEPTVEAPTAEDVGSAKNRAYQRYNDLRKLIDNRRLSKVKFDNDADAKAYDAARKDLFRAVSEYSNAIENAKSDADILNATQRVEDANRALNEAGKKGYVNDKANQNELRKIKKDFYEKTKGTVINIPAEMRGEAGLKDKTMRMLNSALSTLGGNDHIKFSSKGGTPIDTVWNELVSASGNALDINTSNNADMVAQLLDYVEGLKVDGKGVERVPANTYDYAGDDLFDAINQINTESSNRVNNLIPTNEVNNPAQTESKSNKVMAEDIGLNNKPEENNISYTIEAEPEPKNPYVEEGQSQFVTKTAVNAGILNGEQIKNDPVIQDIANKDRHSNKQTFDAAMSIAEKEGDQWAEDVISGKRVLGGEKENSDLDFDTGMIVLQDLDYQIDKATNDAQRQLLTAKKNALLARMTEFSSNAGRTLQAHVKWNNTADGAIINGSKMLGDQTKAWKTRNKKKTAMNGRVAEALGKLKSGDFKQNNTEKVELSHEQIKEEIKNVLHKEFKNAKKIFSDADIDYLATLAADKSISLWQIADEIDHKIKHGKFYTIDESIPIKKKMSSQLANVLRNMGNDSLKEANKPLDNGYPKKSHATIVEEVRNTLETEYAGLGLDTPEDIEFIATMIENSVPSWQIEDEIQHRLLHGEWYEMTEDAVKNLPKMGALSNMLDRISGIDIPKAEKVPDTYEQILEKVKNTFADDSSSFEGNFNDSDYEFIARMFYEGLPKWQIEDELRHRLEHGEFYEITEDGTVKTPTNQKLMNALEGLIEREPTPEKEPKTFAQIREEVKNTLDKESASFGRDYNDSDIDYLANLIQQGATKSELENALNMKMATGTFGISAETQAKVNDLYKYMSTLDPESRYYYDAQMEAFRLIANESAGAASAIEKYDAWRYLAMLGNPKTMIRNWFGNKLFSGLTGFSNTVSAMGEGAFDLAAKARGKEGLYGGRTKAVLNPFNSADKLMIKAGRDYFNNKAYVSGAGTKYKDMKSGIRDAKSVFDNRWVQLYEELTTKGISDTKAVQKKFATSLAGYMKANNMTLGDMDRVYLYDHLMRTKNKRALTDAESAELERLKPVAEKMQEARDYALKQAEYATFHEDNVIADLLTKHTRDWIDSDNPLAKVAGYAIEGTVPFKKTPANIVRSGWEYSPFGIVNALGKSTKMFSETKGKRADYEDTYEVQTRKGTKEVHKTLANEVIDSWSKTFTGDAMMALGYWLFNKGVLNNSNKDEKYQDQLEGIQNYSMTIGNHTYTIDWAAPAVMPLLMGAEIAKINQSKGVPDEEFYNRSAEYWEAANRIFDPIVETSMMQGVKDSIETAANAARFNENLSIPALLLYNSLTGYATQGIPTVSGQLARTVDNTRRSTYAQNEETLGVLEKQSRKILNKIPGLSYLNEPYYDTYGRTQSNSPFEYQSGQPIRNIGRFIGNAGYQFGSPSYVQRINTTDADAMTREVYNDPDAKNPKVFGQWPSSKKINGERISAKDYAEYSQTRGETDYAIRDALANDDWFMNLPNTEKADILTTIPALADRVGEAEINPDFETSDKAYAAFESGGIPSLLDFYKGKNADKTTESMTADAGYSKNSNAYKSIKEEVAAGNTEAAEQKLTDYEVLKQSFDKSHVLSIYDNAKKYDESLTPEQFTSTFKAIDACGTGDEKSNQGISKKEIIAYLNKNNMNEEQGTQILYMYGKMTGSNAWTEVPHLEQGVWKSK
jgi:hypothetical protein